jgi:hypothetical protein
MHLLLRLVGRRVEFDERRRFSDDVPAGNIGKELLGAFDAFPECRELRLVQCREIGERVALSATIRTGRACFRGGSKPAKAFDGEQLLTTDK